MTSYRRAAFALAACTVGLTAACSAGITSASPPKAPTTPASHHPAPPPTHSASPSPSPSLTASAVSVTGLGSFPIPSGAQVAANIACGKGDIIEAAPVTPGRGGGLLHLGASQGRVHDHDEHAGLRPGQRRPDGIETVIFTGHGYSGVIIATANVSSAGSGAASAPAISGSLSHNLLEITLAPGNNPASMPKC